MGALLQPTKKWSGVLGALREVCTLDGMGGEDRRTLVAEGAVGSRRAGGCRGGTDRGGQKVYSSHLERKGHPLEGSCPVGLVTVETFCACLPGW